MLVNCSVRHLQLIVQLMIFGSVEARMAQVLLQAQAPSGDTESAAVVSCLGLAVSLGCTATPCREAL